MIPSYIRAVAYHHVDAGSTAKFTRQLEYFKRHYQCVTMDDLDNYFRSPARDVPGQGKPGLIISFDDGLEQHYTVAAPLLEKYGFKGWFFIPAALPDLTPVEQKEFCSANDLLLPRDSSGRIEMNRDELLDLNRRGHVIGCHTMSHRRFKGTEDASLIDYEVREANEVIASILGSAPRSFAWVGGEPETYHPRVQEALKGEGFSYAFTTMSAKISPNSNPLILHRTVLDADMPYSVFLAKINGLSDLVHFGRRRALEKLLDGNRIKKSHNASSRR